tara:strand:- start:135 stop:638 length:504 start_codon:yes stop_codon:yes gene_type:complete
MRKVSINVCILVTLLGTAIAQPASTNYSQGCGDPQELILRTSVSTPPKIGHEAVLAIYGHRSVAHGLNLSMSFFMAGNYPIYHSMGGINNCLLLQTADYITPLVIGPMFIGGDLTSPRFRVLIPLDPNLIGTHVYWQAANFSLNANPGAITFDNLLTSNGVDWRIDI